MINHLQTELLGHLWVLCFCSFFCFHSMQVLCRCRSSINVINTALCNTEVLLFLLLLSSLMFGLHDFLLYIPTKWTSAKPDNLVFNVLHSLYGVIDYEDSL